MISSELLEILRCPETKTELILDGDYLVSTDSSSRRCYKIENDIPILLLEKSEQLDLDTWEEIMSRYSVKN